VGSSLPRRTRKAAKRPMSEPSSKPPILRALSQPHFQLFLGGLLPNYMTGWVMRVGVGWLAWELTHSPAWLGAIAAADSAPMLLLAPFAGAVSDRMEPLKLIRIAQFLLFLHVVVIMALTWSGLMTIEILFALTIYIGCVYPFHSAARQSIIPSTVPRELFSSAVALDSACYHSNRFVGPAVAALIIPVWGVTGAFFAHVLGAGISVIAFMFLRLPLPDRSKRSTRNLFGDVKEALGYAWTHPAIRPLLLVLALASIFVRPLQDMLPGFADVVFKGDATTLAWLTSAMGVGAVAGAIHIAMRGGINGLTFVALAGYLITAATTLFFALTANLLWGILFAALAGYGLNVMSTCVQALMQLAVDDHYRGRIMSLYLLIFRGTPALGAVALGIAAETFGLQPAFAVSAAICCALFLAVLPSYRTIISVIENKPARP
jgi:MFS family permease